jgi:hypothetical protein
MFSLQYIRPFTIDSASLPLSSDHTLFITEKTLSTGAEVPGKQKNVLHNSAEVRYRNVLVLEMIEQLNPFFFTT